jgi:hypothetical protein
MMALLSREDEGYAGTMWSRFPLTCLMAFSTIGEERIVPC